MLVQGGQLLAADGTVLDFPSRPGDHHELGQWHGAGCVGAVERQLAVADPAADQQPVRAFAFGDRGVGDLD